MEFIKQYKSLSEQEKNKIFKRSELDIADVKESVKKIVNDVVKNGDEAIKSYCQKFDKAKLDTLKVSEEEFTEVETLISDEVKAAIEHGIRNVKKFHENQKPKSMEMVEIEAGVFAGEKTIPIQSVGLYVPRGRGNFPSMLYMQAVPAKLAGVPNISVTTPADENGKIDPGCLYAAKLCGIDTVFKSGGAQAIAAYAYGTDEYPKVDKIIGPGNMYVTAAKRILGDIVDCGLPAGPSESLILADESADPLNAALDLMIEGEHGADSCSIMVTDSQELAEETAAQLKELIKDVPEQRKAFLEAGFETFGAIIVTENQEQAIEFTNDFASEHLQINCESPFDILPLILHAGEIILGDTAFSVANYVIGANAILPTGGKARTWGSVSVRDFIKYSSVLYCTDKGKISLAKTTAVLSKYEHFPCHQAGVTKRNYK